MRFTKLRLMVAGVALALGPATGAMALTFSAVNTSGNSYNLECTACTLLGFDDTSNSINDGIGGTLGASGDAFKSHGGPPAKRDPNLAGSANEAQFMIDVAAYFGDAAIANSYVKDEDSNPLDLSVTVGDYVLWKAGNYSGIAKVTSLDIGSTFRFRLSTNDISHFSKISTVEAVPLPAGGLMLLGGLGGLAFASRRKRKAA